LLNFLLVIFLFFCVRFLPIFAGKGFLHHYSYDSGWYFLFAKYFYKKRKNNKNILDEKLIIYSEIENPALYSYSLSYFFSFFSYSFLQKYFNVFLDLFFSISLFFILQFFDFSANKSLLLVGIYLFSPIFYSITNIGPRLYAITPRLSSEILFTFVIFFMYSYLFISSYYLIPFLILFSSIFYISKFTIQVVFFLLFPVMLFNHSYVLLGLSILTLVINIILSKALRISLKGQFEHLKWYFGMIKNRLFVTNRNSIKLIYKSIISRNLKSFLQSIYKQNSFTSTCIKFFPFFIMIYFMDSSANIFFSSFILVSLILFVLINTKYLIFLGEAERYIVHALLPILIIMGHTFTDETLLLFICIYIFFYIIELIYIYRLYTKDVFIDYNETYNFLKNMNSPKNILLNPLSTLSGFEVAASTQHNILNSSVGFRADIKNIDKLLYEYPILNINNLEFFIQEYDINMMILTEEYFNKLPNHIQNLINNLFILSYSSRNNIYKVYEVK